ncbi:ATP-binding cassette domain-containing protein [Brevibacterium casei]|uniref:ATP-binding cassette, subfamily C, CydC n=1 Tax=Brevibacterium casei CIP 102111 TaxID=1255625 RepID=A0A2H1JLN1_9MICO|nr:ATP-binding cassette domain-containing protein [Brevibacterium casei]QPR39279.1 ATP-binding cassette domain-containing protein [Brevibacterium casei]QPR43445.1 ATP-binding cassette domain-containing protein [Brevibacterium casei]SMX88343.1 ATP-binding cassette, subfamily C, CydC [Brevibacterium casei CIP 102111]
MRNRPRRHVLALTVAVAAELCALGLLAVSGWYLAACALAGLGLFATFSYPTPSGIVRLLALGRIGAGYGQNVLLHRAALADTTRDRLRVFDDLAAAGALPIDDRTVDRLLTEAQDEGERVLRVTAPLVVTVSAILTAVVVILLTAPLAVIPLVIGAVTLLALALLPAESDPGRGRLRAEVLASMDAAPELESLGAAPLLRARILDYLDDLTAAEQRRDSRQLRRQVVAALAGGLAFGAVIVVSAASLGVGDLDVVPLFVMIVCLAFGVLERTVAISGIVPHLERLRGHRARRISDPSRVPVPPRPVDVAADGTITLGAGTGSGTLLTIPPGGSAAIIGPSGAGKSTLLTSIAEAVRGAGTATAAERTAAVPSVAHVADDEFLFTGTIAANLRLGAPTELTPADLAGVLTALGLDDDITPDTRTGIGGRALSRGETRRLVIARAVVTAPDVLLVDEPDLGLDTGSFVRMLEFIRTRLPAATIIVAAHRSPPGVEFVLDLSRSEAAGTRVPADADVPTGTDGPTDAGSPR